MLKDVDFQFVHVVAIASLKMMVIHGEQGFLYKLSASNFSQR